MKANTARLWTDEALRRAVATEHCWRAVSRSLGLASTSSAVRIRVRAEQLGLNYAHFRGQRSWSDDALREAVAKASSWNEVASILGLVGSGEVSTSLQVRSYKIGLTTSHLGARRVRPEEINDLAAPTFDRFPMEAQFLVAAWFTSRGARVSLAQEGCPYDLVADFGPTILKVQVKSFQDRGVPRDISVGRLTASASIVNGNRRKLPYAPGDLDVIVALSTAGSLFYVPATSIVGQSSLRVSEQSPFFVERLPVRQDRE